MAIQSSNDSNDSNRSSNKAAISHLQIIHYIYCTCHIESHRSLQFTMTHSSTSMFSFCLLLVVVAALFCLLAEPTIASSPHSIDEDGASSSSYMINSRFHALRERAMNNPTIPEKFRGKTLSDFVVANKNNENEHQQPQRQQQQQKRRRQNNNNNNRQAQEEGIEFQNAAASPSTNFFAVSLSRRSVFLSLLCMHLQYHNFTYSPDDFRFPLSHIALYFYTLSFIF